MAKGAAVAAAAAARERKGATAVGREGKGTAAARERKSTAATAAAVGRDGGGAAAVVAAVGGAAAAASSRHGSGPAVAPVGGLYFTGAASDGCPSFNSQATDGRHTSHTSSMRMTSGHSDQMWIDKAHKFYEDDNKDLKLGHFVLMDVWYAVRAEAKWVTYNNELKKARKRKDSDKVEGSEPIDLDERPCPRPIGQKAAKRAAYEGNLAKSGKRATEPIDVDELDRYGKIQSEAHANRLKVLEIQQKLSAERMESSKIAHLAAKEQKEARKLELEARMMESYNILQAQDVSRMSDEEKADHAHTLKCLKKRLFPETI
ncbi:hypothetical protein ACP70R_004503 [Stipagrostis hirtigluma subsp. patula]